MKDTGAVVITWSTQSELNNAGFFIKRSRQRDGQFEIINARLIPGAGTTSERQFYTYEDTTAQANVVYYYQIEDVSLDGNRQVLTRGIRLRGDVGAAGKATEYCHSYPTLEDIWKKRNRIRDGVRSSRNRRGLKSASFLPESERKSKYSIFVQFSIERHFLKPRLRRGREA